MTSKRYIDIQLRCAVLALLLLLALSNRALWACPFCGSDTATQVRARLFNADFGSHAMAVVAPFTVLLALLLLVAWWPARRTQ